MEKNSLQTDSKSSYLQSRLDCVSSLAPEMTVRQKEC